MAFDMYSSGYNAGWMSDDQHFDVIERVCEECGGAGACMSFGTLCVECWERVGQPMPDAQKLILFEDVREFRKSAFNDI